LGFLDADQVCVRHILPRRSPIEGGSGVGESTHSLNAHTLTVQRAGEIDLLVCLESGHLVQDLVDGVQPLDQPYFDVRFRQQAGQMFGQRRVGNFQTPGSVAAELVLQCKFEQGLDRGRRRALLRTKQVSAMHLVISHGYPYR